ncbi:MAG: hypothetical protein ACFB0G_11135 [Leptolyngbyaceae cyanobacterium]
MHPYGPDSVECEDRETPPKPYRVIEVDEIRVVEAINRVIRGLDERIVALSQASEAAEQELERLGLFNRLPIRQWATDPLGISDWLKAQTADILRVWAHGFDTIAEFLHECASRLD